MPDGWTALPETPARASDGEGRVTLVGAGPGDAELLTVRAVRALETADVVLYDDLVSDDVLACARRGAALVPVGKRAGRRSCRQDDIDALMVLLARQGRHVVRLKSGDPMVFGRAGEEIAALRAAGIAVQVVPGITAGLAAAAALGTSLTHRDCAHSVRFVTGHGRSGALPDGIDWRGLADRETTLVLYMAGRTGAAASARLIAEGLDPATPAAVIAAISRPDERHWIGRLDRLADGLGEIGIDGPVLIGVGTVFAAASRDAAYSGSSSVSQ
jgi:uroporphyrin-III C-methyltransferase/precorrin-2 dehydrogenase/sirohydrochlorin ferrochelatase